MTSSSMEVETSDRELIYTRTFDAPRELVFQAYSSCEHLTHWWGPRTWPMAECTMDFRQGGSWHYCLRGPNEGDESWGLAVFEEIVEPERLVYRDYFADEEGNVNEAMPTVLTRLEFSQEDGHTKITGRAEYPSPADLETVLEMGMVEGMTETLDRLEEHLADVLASAQGLTP